MDEQATLGDARLQHVRVLCQLDSHRMRSQAGLEVFLIIYTDALSFLGRIEQHNKEDKTQLN